MSKPKKDWTIYPLGWILLAGILALFGALFIVGCGNEKDQAIPEEHQLDAELTAAVIETCESWFDQESEIYQGTQLVSQMSFELVYDAPGKYYRSTIGSGIIAQPAETLNLPKPQTLLTDYMGALNENPHFVHNGEWIVYTRSLDFKPRFAGAGYGGEAYSLWAMKSDGSKKREIVPYSSRKVQVNATTGKIFYLNRQNMINTITLYPDGTTTSPQQLSNIMSREIPRFLAGSDNMLVIRYYDGFSLLNVRENFSSINVSGICQLQR